ncbi:MAG: hypothetical protein HOF74_05625 [Gammaproteobacteria bacterium]|jgi:hypothetical protein|nr:hypothetical protein [Gammaproteobacteria bacterium]MBT3859290.1 hypothetical protein [Gammaproteobacteria bacterium]MBT3987980.1 hypothetical protein [Gammaproteobacteria bacterium]MBT4255408.1 hypothetical protein [Gammaproteobacteria bacterium]MBT4583069.1 hypothetical protein [Gammaproteobacteria bacterium]
MKKIISLSLSLPFYFLILTLVSLSAGTTLAQTNRPTLVGTWEGSTAIGTDAMKIAFTFVVEDGEYTATLTNRNEGVYGMPVKTLTLRGLNLEMRLPDIGVDFFGRLRLNDAGDTVLRIDGDWFKRSEMTPVVLLLVAE